MPRQRGSDLIAVNRRARFDYEIDDTVEAGIVLTGTEVKSLRAHRGTSIAEAFATVRGGEAWLVQATIPEYDFGNRANHDPRRQRKLLLHRRELDRLASFTEEQGRTLVPLRLYWKDGKAKILIGLGTGKARYEKRAAMAERDARRDVERALRDRQRN